MVSAETLVSDRAREFRSVGTDSKTLWNHALVADRASMQADRDNPFVVIE